jgi:hypothetical protein
MHHKNIKLIVRKQLKNQFPNWKRLPKKNKKELARKVLAEVVSEYDFIKKTMIDQTQLCKFRSRLSSVPTAANYWKAEKIL